MTTRSALPSTASARAVTGTAAERHDRAGLHRTRRRSGRARRPCRRRTARRTAASRRGSTSVASALASCSTAASTTGPGADDGGGAPVVGPGDPPGGERTGGGRGRRRASSQPTGARSAAASPLPGERTQCPALGPRPHLVEEGGERVVAAVGPGVDGARRAAVTGDAEGGERVGHRAGQQLGAVAQHLGGQAHDADRGRGVVEVDDDEAVGAGQLVHLHGRRSLQAGTAPRHPVARRPRPGRRGSGTTDGFRRSRGGRTPTAPRSIPRRRPRRPA